MAAKLSPELITRTGIELCRRHGPDAITMRMLACKLGVSATAIYRHIDGKAELFERMVAVANEEFYRYLLRPFKMAEPVGRYRKMVHEYRRFGRNEPALYDILFRSNERGRLSDATRRATSKTFQLLVECVRECVASGQFRGVDAQQAALTTWGMAHGLIDLHRRGRFSNESMFTRQYEHSLSHLLDGLLETSQ